MSNPKVFVCGVPNAGKTTLFNGLTGKNARVGNWYGVTTKSEYGWFEYRTDRGGKKRISVVDLPGSYFDDYTLEQGATDDEFANSSGVDGVLILVVCPATNIKSGLTFLKRAARLGLPIVLVLNFYEELKKQGGKIDVATLQRIIGVPVVVAECNTKKGVCAVGKIIAELMIKRRIETHTVADFDEEFVKKSVFFGKRVYKMGKIDRLMLKPVYNGCFLLLSSVCTLYLAFGRYGVGSCLSYFSERLLDILITKPTSELLKWVGVSDFVFGFITEGILGGMISVIVFLPRLAILTVFTCFIEESGILARIAFAENEFFRLFGLTGRAVFALLTGFGCTAVAVISASGLENDRLRKRMVLSLPFVPCSAKVPVFSYLSVAIGAIGGFSGVLLLWLCGLLLALLYSRLSMINGKKSDTPDLIVELPPYRMPKGKIVLKTLQNFAKSFIIRIGSIIALVTAVLWLLKSVSIDLRFVPDDISQSVLVAVAEKLQFVFYPACVKNWRFVVAAIAGAFAKENVLSVLALLGTGGASARELLAFALFFALYPPCLASLAAIFKQEGIKCVLHVVCFQYALAFAVFYSVLQPIYSLMAIPILLPLLIFSRRAKKGIICYEKNNRGKRRRAYKPSS